MDSGMEMGMGSGARGHGNSSSPASKATGTPPVSPESGTAALELLSHELRTPLSLIMGHALLARAEATEPDTDNGGRVAQRLDKILAAAQRLVNTISQLEDYMALAQGAPADDSDSVDVRLLVNGCLEGIEAGATAKNITLRNEVAETFSATIAGNSVRVYRVLLVLLGNAVMYNRQGGEVRVRAERMGSKVRIGVLDTGPGIPAHRQAEVFMPFHRLSETGNADGGLGLDLALARQIVETLGGSMGFFSRPEQGSHFWFDLPLAQEAAAEAGGQAAC